jgi:hypothetical protein
MMTKVYNKAIHLVFGHRADIFLALFISTFSDSVNCMNSLTQEGFQSPDTIQKPPSPEAPTSP